MDCWIDSIPINTPLVSNTYRVSGRRGNWAGNIAHKAFRRPGNHVIIPKKYILPILLYKGGSKEWLAVDGIIIAKTEE